MTDYLRCWPVVKYRVSNRYTFSKFAVYQKVPTELFDNDDLSATEMSMLLILREYCDNKLKCSKSLLEIAESAGIGIRVLKRNYKSLMNKKYILEIEDFDLPSGTVSITFELAKINWYKVDIVSSSYPDQNSHMKDIVASLRNSYKGNYELKEFTI